MKITGEALHRHLLNELMHLKGFASCLERKWQSKGQRISVQTRATAVRIGQEGHLEKTP